MFHSEFCIVDYIENENAVLLTWRKFCHNEDYRAPVTHALKLLQTHEKSHFIVDARNGFVDEEADVAWGISEFLPKLPQTGCTNVVFILNAVNDIEDEMNLWTREFKKYCNVASATSYAAAVTLLSKRTNALSLQVIYTVKAGKRDEFYAKLKEYNIIQASRNEAGNSVYAYYFPVENEDQILLLETWANREEQEKHTLTPHYRQLQKLKSAYVTDIQIAKYQPVTE